MNYIKVAIISCLFLSQGSVKAVLSSGRINLGAQLNSSIDLGSADKVQVNTKEVLSQPLSIIKDKEDITKSIVFKLPTNSTAQPEASNKIFKNFDVNDFDGEGARARRIRISSDINFGNVELVLHLSPNSEITHYNFTTSNQGHKQSFADSRKALPNSRATAFRPYGQDFLIWIDSEIIPGKKILQIANMDPYAGILPAPSFAQQELTVIFEGLR